MKVEHLTIPEVMLIVPRRFGDVRGHFAETFNTRRYTEIGIGHPFVQDNESLSRHTGTLRGLHCQVAPYAQGKLVHAIAGAVWDVAVDVRSRSPTYGIWVAAKLTAWGGEQLWIPPGFLHGFVTIEPDTVISYKVTNDYVPDAERGVVWNDSGLRIPWPLDGDPLLSDKDKHLPPFAAAHDWFPAQ